MHSNWWLSTLSVSEVVGLAFVLNALSYKGRAKNWPFLCAAVGFELASDLVLMSLLGHTGKGYWWYFYTYWISAAVQPMLRLGIIADVAKSFPGLDFIPLKWHLLVSCFGATIAAASGVHCYQNPAHLWQSFVDSVFLVNTCVSIALGVFCVVLLLCSRLPRLAWSRQGQWIASGLLIRTAGAMIVSQLLSARAAASHDGHSFRLVANAIDSLCSIAAFFFWSKGLLQHLPIFRRISEDDSPANSLSITDLLMPRALSREL